jgi:hypothetical protein
LLGRSLWPGQNFEALGDGLNQLAAATAADRNRMIVEQATSTLTRDAALGILGPAEEHEEWRRLGIRLVSEDDEVRVALAQMDGPTILGPDRQPVPGYGGPGRRSICPKPPPGNPATKPRHERRTVGRRTRGQHRQRRPLDYPQRERTRSIDSGSSGSAQPLHTSRRRTSRLEPTTTKTTTWRTCRDAARRSTAGRIISV